MDRERRGGCKEGLVRKNSLRNGETERVWMGVYIGRSVRNRERERESNNYFK